MITHAINEHLTNNKHVHKTNSSDITIRIELINNIIIVISAYALIAQSDYSHNKNNTIRIYTDTLQHNLEISDPELFDKIDTIIENEAQNTYKWNTEYLDSKTI